MMEPATAQDMLKPAEGAAASSDSVICIEDSDHVSLDVGADSADQEQELNQRPKRNIKEPARFTPVKYPPGRRRGVGASAGRPPKQALAKHRAAQLTAKRSKGAVQQVPAAGVKKRGRPSKNAFIPLSMAVKLTPATPAMAAAAAAEATPSPAAAGPEADLQAAALGLELAGQYSRLLTQVQALLSSLHPSQVRLSCCPQHTEGRNTDTKQQSQHNLQHNSQLSTGLRRTGMCSPAQPCCVQDSTMRDAHASTGRVRGSLQNNQHKKGIARPALLHPAALAAMLITAVLACHCTVCLPAGVCGSQGPAE